MCRLVDTNIFTWTSRHAPVHLLKVAVDPLGPLSTAADRIETPLVNCYIKFFLREVLPRQVKRSPCFVRQMKVG